METGQLLIPVVSSFAITVIFLPLFIGYLRLKKEGQTIREEGPKWHEKKSGTPTMGGVIFLIGILITSIWVGMWVHQLTHSLLISLFVMILYGTIGFLDDYIKITKKRNLGLRAWQKLLGQIIVGAIFLLVYFYDGFPPILQIPGIGTINSGIVYCLFVLFWLVGFSNAVNLTDGLDGLVAGLGIIAYGTYGIIAWQAGRIDILIMILATVGGLCGFMIYNHKPAKIFMGDVGSLALGGGLAAISILLHREFSLLLIGLVFVLETLSVILQIASFKLTGNRIFKMSPIHHHFEMLGWSEWKVDIVFWAVGLVCAILYLILFL